jgi:type III restriction enzyme
MVILSKTDYLIFRECSKNAWLKIHRPDVFKKTELSEFDKAIIETGNEVEKYARELFPGGVMIEGRDSQAQALTLKHIADKTPVLFQPVFLKDGFLAALDILKFDSEARGYFLYEVKSSNEVKEDTHLSDLAFQCVLLEKMGVPGRKAHIIHLNSDYVRAGALDVGNPRSWRNGRLPWCCSCHRSLENQPRKVELIRPLSLHKRNKHFHSKKLHSRALRGVFWNENANLRKLTGWFDSTLAGRFVVTADTVPDVIAYLQAETELTRSTIVRILKESKRLPEFLVNPQKFMDAVAAILKQQLHKLMIDGIKYERVAGEEFSMMLFEEKEIVSYLNNRLEVKKSVYDAVVYDSELEREFAEALDKREDIKLFVKLPDWFKIETPLGTYNPDWAILKHDNTVLYLVRETKGTKNFEKLRNIEAEKIRCGRKHFETLKVDFDVVTSAKEV